MWRMDYRGLWVKAKKLVRKAPLPKKQGKMMMGWEYWDCVESEVESGSKGKGHIKADSKILGLSKWANDTSIYWDGED